MNDSNFTPKNDLLTIAGISIIVFAFSSLIHEGVGHGGACLAVGCKPLYLSSMNFEGDESMLRQVASRIISASGSLANLLAGLLALALFRRTNQAAPALRYFFWLLATVNLLQATGYLLFSGIGNIGDWASVIDGLRPWWGWRLLLALVGAASYWFSVRLMLRYASVFIGNDATERFRRSQVLMLIPYFVGAAISCIAGLFNPAGIALVLGSALPASLGGTSGLAWGSQLLRGKGIKTTHEKPLPISRSWSWIGAAIIIGTLFIVILGKGIKF